MKQDTLSSSMEERMSAKRTVQYISGYVLGGLLFLILIPWGLYRVSLAFDHLIGMQLIPFAGLRVTLAVILLLVGLLFGVWSNVVLNVIGKGGPFEIAGVEVSPKTQNLVVTGPYRYTRNPMLFGACSIYYAVAIYLNSLTAIAVVFLFMTFMLIYVKLTEECRLQKEFENYYDEYRRRVSMFFPWGQKR
jgi:protein-S-isoprenylcysteine O-methyltransferase Ste14